MLKWFAKQTQKTADDLDLLERGLLISKDLNFEAKEFRRDERRRYREIFINGPAIELKNGNTHTTLKDLTMLDETKQEIHQISRWYPELSKLVSQIILMFMNCQ